MKEFLEALWNGLGSLIGTFIGFWVAFALAKQSANNERKNHISQTRFDKEFEIYQELSEKNLTAVYDAGITVMIVRGMYDEEKEKITKHFSDFCKHLNDAEFSNKKYAPFINREIFLKYKELEDKIRDIFKLFGFWATAPDDATFRYKEERYSKYDIKARVEIIQKEVSALSDEILDNVRDYLQKLDVLK